MKAKEFKATLKSKDATELNKELIGLRKAQFSLRMQIATQQMSNTSQLGKVRKDIARVKTILHEKAAAK
jgi:large subunit ribosomal protein L29